MAISDDNENPDADMVFVFCIRRKRIVHSIMLELLCCCYAGICMDWGLGMRMMNEKEVKQSSL